jgi:hypothetical protein
MLPALVGLLVVPATTQAHTQGCNTKTCDKRIGHHVRWHAAGATTFGGPGDGSSGHTGYRGADLNVQWRSWAELGNGCALGCLPQGTKLRILIPSTGRKLTLVKNDIGLGGGPIAGLPRLIDLWHAAASALGVGGVWSGRVLYRRVK